MDYVHDFQEYRSIQMARGRLHEKGPQFPGTVLFLKLQAVCIYIYIGSVSARTSGQMPAPTPPWSLEFMRRPLCFPRPRSDRSAAHAARKT